MPIDEHRIGQGPADVLPVGVQASRAAGRADGRGDGTHSRMLACHPARVLDQDNLLAGASTCLCSERFEFGFEESGTDGRGHMGNGAARCRMHESDEVAPGETVFNWSDRTLAVKRPDLAQDGPPGQFGAHPPPRVQPGGGEMLSPPAVPTGAGAV
jgi:hypothetical protein